jgi:hypothetical protein
MILLEPSAVISWCPANLKLLSEYPSLMKCTRRDQGIWVCLFVAWDALPKNLLSYISKTLGALSSTVCMLSTIYI